MFVLANDTGNGEIYGPFAAPKEAEEYLKQKQEEFARNHPNGRRGVVTFATYSVRKLTPVAATKAVEAA